jgi:hypothetical protein
MYCSIHFETAPAPTVMLHIFQEPRDLKAPCPGEFPEAGSRDGKNTCDESTVLGAVATESCLLSHRDLSWKVGQVASLSLASIGATEFRLEWPYLTAPAFL